MRGRTLLVGMLGLVALSACSKKESLYIDPGKAEATPKPAPAPAAAPAAAPKATPGPHA